MRTSAAAMVAEEGERTLNMLQHRLPTHFEGAVAQAARQQVFTVGIDAAGERR